MLTAPGAFAAQDARPGVKTALPSACKRSHSGGKGLGFKAYCFFSGLFSIRLGLGFLSLG